MQASETSESPSYRQRAAQQELVKEQGRRSLTTSGTRPVASQPDAASASEDAAAEATSKGEQQEHGAEPQPAPGAPEENAGAAEPQRSLMQEEQLEGCATGAQHAQGSLQPSAAQQGSPERRSQGELALESWPEHARSRPSAVSKAEGLSAGAEALGAPGQGAGRGTGPLAVLEAAGSSGQGSDLSQPQSRCPLPCCNHCMLVCPTSASPQALCMEHTMTSVYQPCETADLSNISGSSGLFGALPGILL